MARAAWSRPGFAQAVGAGPSAEVDGDLTRSYTDSISPVLSEHPLRFAATACGARFRPTTHPKKEAAAGYLAHRALTRAEFLG